MVYSKYAGTELEVQGDSFVLLKVRQRGVEASGDGGVVLVVALPSLLLHVARLPRFVQFCICSRVTGMLGLSI